MLTRTGMQPDILTWAAADGGFLGPLAVHTFPRTGRGICATRALQPGELLLRVPQRRVLTSEGALGALAPLLSAAGAAGASLHALLEEDDVLALSALLLASLGAALAGEAGEAGGEGAGAGLPYLASLPPPQDVCCVVGAGCWQASELAAVGDGALVQQGQRRAGEVAAAHAALGAVAAAALEGGAAGEAARLQRALGRALQPSAALWRWCVACTTSRAFICGLGADPLFSSAGVAGMLPLALVPGSDLFNHCSSSIEAGSSACVAETEWVQGEAGGAGAYEVRCPPASRFTPTRAGQEVFISYGDRGARDLCENYGFCPAAAGSNASECMVLPLGSILSSLAEGSSSSSSSSSSSAAPSFVGLLMQGCAEGNLVRKTELLECCCGLPAEELELELPLDLNSEGATPALPTDTSKVLRVLCLSDKELSLGTMTAIAERLERPLSRANETLANALLVFLLVSQCLQPQPPGAGGTGEGGRHSCDGSRSPMWGMSAQGIPQLTQLARRELTAAFVHAAGGEAGSSAAPPALRLSTGSAITAFAQRTRAACALLVLALQEVLALEERALAAREVSMTAQQQQQQQQQQQHCTPAAAPPALPWLPTAEHLDAAFMRPCATGRRAHLAASYRTARARVFLAHAAYVHTMLGVASGGSALPTPAGCAAPPPCPPAAALPRHGLEVQQPWGQLLLQGAKGIETRGYPPPPGLLNSPVLLLESCAGSGLVFSGAPLPSASARCIGTVTFTCAKRYATRQEWEADAALHCVAAQEGEGGAFAWVEGCDKWGWVVGSVSAEAGGGWELQLTPSQRAFRSIFLLPWG